MKEKTNKTGRPPKISTEEKKQIIMNYFLFEAQGSAERMSVHNIYAILSAYANKKGYNIKPYDLSRDEQVKKHIKCLVLTHNQDHSIIPAYIKLDINSLIRKPSEEIAKALIDRENYCMNMHTRTARALEEFKSLNSQINSLKDIQEELTQKAQDLSRTNEVLKEAKIQLEKENKYLKSYIKRRIEPILAEQVISGKIDPELAVNEQQLLKKGLKPSEISLTDYINGDINNKDMNVSARSILKMINKKEK